MAILFTADLHLGHKKILNTRTKFKNIQEHDEYLLERWNAKVKDQDEVYILGDLSFRASQHISSYLCRVRGRKRLIVGNHDQDWMEGEELSLYFETVNHLKTLELENRQITLCHYPMLEWAGSRSDKTGASCLIHGHIHAITDSEVYRYIQKYLPYALNAGVDVNHFQPVTFEELKENCDVWYKRR